MRDRILTGVLCASALLGWVAHNAAARNPNVKIIGGPQFTDPANFEAEIQSTAPIPREPLPGEDIQADLAKEWDNPTSEPTPLLDTEGSFSSCEGDVGSPCDGDCQCGGAGCALCCRPYGWAVGVEATYLKPDFQESNDAFDPPNNFQYQAAPRVWAEYVMMNGWGVRGAYWTYDAQQSFSNTANSTDTVAASQTTDNLNLYAIDLELTRRFQIYRSQFWLSLGARNGRLKRSISQQLSVFDLAGGGGDDATFIQQQGDRDFNGTGITTNIGLRRLLGTSRIALVSNFRNSVLWGGNQVNVNGTLGEVVPVGAGDLNLNSYDQLSLSGSNSQAMWIGEFQVGGEWICPLAGTLDGGWAFARLMFEAQWWKVPGVDVTGFGPDRVNSQMYDFMGVAAAAGICR
jgi:hypothetical protein